VTTLGWIAAVEKGLRHTLAGCLMKKLSPVRN